MYYANLYVGESVTMSTESALLGTPSILISSLPEMGVPRELEKYKIIRWYKNWDDDIYNMIQKIINNDKSFYKKIRDEIFNNKLDVTQYIYDQVKKVALK